MLIEQEALYAAGMDDEACTMRGDVLLHSVAVMSALRLLHRDDSAGARHGAQLDDYLVVSNVFFPVVEKKLAFPGQPECDLRDATASEVERTIDWICLRLLRRSRSGRHTCVMRFADHNPVCNGVCQFEVTGGEWTATAPAQLHVTMYQLYGGDDRAAVADVTGHKTFFESLKSLVFFVDGAVKHHIRVVRVTFVYVAPRLTPVKVGCYPVLWRKPRVVLDPQCDPMIRTNLEEAAAETSLADLKKRLVHVTCELWFAAAVAAHLTPAVFDLLPDTEYTLPDW